MRRVTTKRSLWIFDEDNKLFCRMPKSEAPAVHERLSYDETHGWLEYDELEMVEIYGETIIKVRGGHVQTGYIETDTGSMEVV